MVSLGEHSSRTAVCLADHESGVPSAHRTFGEQLKTTQNDMEGKEEIQKGVRKSVGRAHGRHGPGWTRADEAGRSHPGKQEYRWWTAFRWSAARVLRSPVFAGSPPLLRAPPWPTQFKLSSSSLYICKLRPDAHADTDASAATSMRLKEVNARCVTVHVRQSGQVRWYHACAHDHYHTVPRYQLTIVCRTMEHGT
jgi:hypothetical protein